MATPTSVAPRFQDSLAYSFPPITRSSGHWHVLFTRQANEAIVKSIPNAFDPSRGSVVLTAYSCGGRPGPGIVVTTPDADTTVFYHSGPTYDPGLEATDGVISAVGIARAPPGALRIDFTLKETSQHIGTVNVQVRPDAIPYFWYYPGPT